MATFTFTGSDGKPFTLNAPEGITRDQAEAIFKKQDSTGSLVGFKPGDILSAASQAAAGLTAAQGALQQAQSGITGAIGGLGSVAGVGSVSTALGPAGGAQGGSLAATAIGLTATVGPAVTALSGAVSTLAGAASRGMPLQSAAVIQSSTAISSIQTINKNITELPVTNPINTADFAKVTAGLGSAVSAIGPMSVPEVNATLAQAKNLVNQAAATITDSKGLGSFGLDVRQLETAGFVKPGVAALADKTSSSLTSVLSSPAAWTGKDGIRGAEDLLANPGKQSQIQQDLMTKGVAALGAVGIPVQNLSSQGIAGMALNAAKSVPGAEAFAKGLPIPGDATGSVTAAFGSAVRDGAFAVNLVNTKIPTVFKEQDIPVPKIDTVNRASLDAASARVVGDPKVPVPSYTNNTATGTVSEYESKVKDWIQNYYIPLNEKILAVNNKIGALLNQQSITQAQYDAVNSERDAFRNWYNTEALSVLKDISDYYDALSYEDKTKASAGPYSQNSLRVRLKDSLTVSTMQKEQLNTLQSKIAGETATA